jgi:type-F conjugative transfer system pilin assembly protein TrbC
MPLVGFADTKVPEMPSSSEMELIMEKAPYVLEGTGCSKECTKPLTTENGADLEAMMDRFSSLHKKNDGKKNETPELFVLVSLSMPEQSLKQWSEQANKVGATLLLRGLVENSIKKTVEKAQHLFGETEKGGFNVDPERFQMFKADKVPAVVLLTKESPVCDQEPCDPQFDIVYGDIPLIEALEQIARRGSADGQKIAKDLLKKYREHNG